MHGENFEDIDGLSGGVGSLDRADAVTGLPPDPGEESNSKESFDDTKSQLEWVFGKGASKMAITFEENPKSKRTRDVELPLNNEQLEAQREALGSEPADSKKPKLLGEIGFPLEGSDNVMDKDKDVSGCVVEEQYAASGEN